MKKFIMEFTILILISLPEILYGQDLLIEPEDESGELYIQTLNMPNELTTEVSISLVGMSFSGGRYENKIYSHNYTSRSGTTQTITGGNQSINPNGKWTIEHIEDMQPTSGKTWIGYGLYKIEIDSFYFYLDYLDSDYPFIYQPDIKITYEYRPTPHKNIIKIFAMFNSSNQITIENNGEVINVSKDLFLNQEIQATNFHIQGEVPLNDLIDDHLFTNVIVDGNNTIAVGKTLTINRNDYPDPSKLDEIGMRFNSSTSLTINGTLNAIGTSTGRITFDRSGTTGTWGSITFDGSTASGSILDNVNIKYASDVKCLNGANITIQNSLIDHCTQGIYVYNSQPQILNNQIKEPVQNGIYCDALGKSPLILNNLITKASSNPTFRNYQGIWLVNHTNGYIAHNDINGFCFGIYVGSGSCGYFTNYSMQNFYPNNRIMNNLYGFAAGWGSSIGAGYGMYYGWNNSVYNNAWYDVYCYQSSSVTAQYNYWGGGLPKQYVDGTSYLNVLYSLTSEPWGGSLASNSQEIPNAETYTSSSSLSSINDNSTFSDIYMAINLELTGRIEEAIALYKIMFEKNTNTNFALTSLARIKNKYNRADLLDYFITLSNIKTTYRNTVLKILAGMYLQDNEYEKALNLYDEIIKSDQNNYEGVSAKFEKFFAALNYKKDKETALKLLSEISSLKLTEEELISQKEFLAYLLYGTDSNNRLNKEANETNSSIESGIRKEYSLDQNYPNPFNPSTVINYSVKDEGLVKVKIYDILGSEVAELVNETKESGNHPVEFNASNLSSGVYIYTLQVNGYLASKKMLLIK